MAGEATGFATAKKTAVGVILVALAPIIGVLTGFLTAHPIAAIILMLAYYGIVALIGLTAKIWNKLIEIWVTRIAESADVKFQQALSGYRRNYLRYVRSAHAHMDMKGLTTRGEYALAVDDIFIQLSLDPNSLHNLDASLIEYASDSDSPYWNAAISRASSLTPLRGLGYGVRLATHIAKRVISEPRKWKPSRLLESIDEAARAFVAREGEVGTPTPQDIWDWLRIAADSRTVLVIVGPPGSGKTTLLKHVAISMAEWRRRSRALIGSQKIPVIVALRDHKDKFSASGLDHPLLADVIRSSLRDMQRTEPPNWVEAQLENGRMLVMFDGLDEVAIGDVRKSISDWIEKQRQAYPEVPLIVTSRPFGYQNAPLNSATVVQVQPFTEVQVQSFTRRWYIATSIRSYGGDTDAARMYANNSATELLDRLYDSTALLSLTVNPLLLTMIATVHHYRGALPGTRIELYKEICDVLLGKRHQARGVVLDVDMSAPQKQSVLQVLAHHMMQSRMRDVSLDSAAACIADTLTRVAPHVAPAEFLEHIEQSSGLLIEREAGEFAFAHLTFQEYFASTYIREERREGDLIANIQDPWWRETILLYAAQADATAIVTTCLQDIDKLPLLSLAVQCSEEGREISLSARRALGDFISGDVRTSPGRRRAAGGVKLFRRARTFSRVAEDEYVSPWPITCLEYQLFIDEVGSVESAIPDHWREGVFEAGADNDPILGVRSEDVQRFCEWAQRLYGDQWNYGLLRGEQLSDRTLLQKLKHQKLGAAFVEKPQLRPTRPEVEISRLPGFSPDSQILESELEIDKRSLQFEADDSGLQYVDDTAGLDLGRLLTRERVRALWDNESGQRRNLMANWQKMQMWDLQWAQAQTERLVQGVLSFAYRTALEEVAKLRSDLAGTAQALGYGMAISCARSLNPQVRILAHRRERFFCRLASLAAADICRTLASKEPGELPSRQPARRSLRSLFSFRHSPNEDSGYDTRGDSTKEVLLQMAWDFESIYCALALFESRAERRSTPWEGFFLVRRRATDGPYR
ncbi:NACHT domain-containing protein [Streptomyces sp. NPDC058864]